MITKTSNPYRFRYLITSLSGEGVKEVFLPERPPEDEIHFKEEQKWTRPEPPSAIQKEIIKIGRKLRDEKSPDYDPYYVSPFQPQIDRWIEQEEYRHDHGFWFWNDGVPTYITGFYYFYLTQWLLYFGRPEYRETDKELTYFIKYCEEDEDCFGLLLNTIRRYGKSALFGCLSYFRTINSFKHYTGMQGEKEGKIYDFYDIFIVKPFQKLPFYLTPVYDTSTTLSTGIEFKQKQSRGTKTNFFGDEDEILDSRIEYRNSGESDYDQAVLHTYILEEPGKTITCNISDRWKFVKPCLKRGIFVRGKAFGGTTVEFMDVSNRGGKAYQKLVYESDFDKKQSDGRTISGLYFCFIPGDCALEGFYDDYGHPMQERARRFILNEREAVKNNPKDYSDLVRKYPLSIREIFYISTENCEFNALILQERKAEIELSVDPLYSRYDLYWENNVRFSKVKFRHNPSGGWLKAAWLPRDVEKEANMVDAKFMNGVKKYTPKNDAKFCAGIDPIDHGIVIEAKANFGEDEFLGARRSKPVMFVKMKYDSSIDGVFTQDELERNTETKHRYKTNRYIIMMDTRPNDPNVLYERALMICWFFGVSLHVENQKPGIIRYFYQQDCENFILHKYTPVDSNRKNQFDDGTPASLMTIQEYTGDLASYIEYFGHTIPFVDLIEDLLLFNPRKTTEYDYAVAAGFTELAGKMKPKVQPKPPIDIRSLFSQFNPYTGEIMN